MEIILYITDAFNNKHIHKTFTEHSLIPNVNDTICLSSIGDFVVARREFGYHYDDEYGYQMLNYVNLQVYPKPTYK